MTLRTLATINKDKDEEWNSRHSENTRGKWQEMLLLNQSRLYSNRIVCLKEQEEYGFATLFQRILDQIQDDELHVSEDALKDCLRNDLTDWEQQNQPQANRGNGRYSFKFVGLISLRNLSALIKSINQNTSSRVDILLFVAPKWSTEVDDAQLQSIITSTIFKAILAFLRSERRKSVENELHSSYVRNGDSSSFLDTFFSVALFTKRHGILKEAVIQRSKRRGEEDWARTFARREPMFSSNQPYYPFPERKRKSRISTELSRIHQDIYDYCMTYLSQFFRIRTTVKYSHRHEFSSRELGRMRKVVRLAMLRTKVHKDREKIRVLKRFLEQYNNIGHSQKHTFGLSSESFNLLWEDVLLTTLGDASLTQQINDLFKQFRMRRNGVPVDQRKRMKIDGVQQNSDVLILMDAKNYTDWRDINTGDLNKQYIYEYAINQLIDNGTLISTHVRKNIFLFPKNPSNPLAEEADFDLVGNYEQPFMTYISDRIEWNATPATDTRFWGEGILAVEIEAFSLLRNYAEHNRELNQEFFTFLGLN